MPGNAEFWHNNAFPPFFPFLKKKNITTLTWKLRAIKCYTQQNYHFFHCPLFPQITINVTIFLYTDFIFIFIFKHFFILRGGWHTQFDNFLIILQRGFHEIWLLQIKNFILELCLSMIFLNLGFVGGLTPLGHFCWFYLCVLMKKWFCVTNEVALLQLSLD